MHTAGAEPAMPASKRPQTYTWDREATGIGRSIISLPFFLFS